MLHYCKREQIITQLYSCVIICIIYPVLKNCFDLKKLTLFEVQIVWSIWDDAEKRCALVFKVLFLQFFKVDMERYDTK